MKLWDKNISTEDKILSFTTGMDPVFDMDLAPFDVMGSMAHAIMLAEVGLIEKKEAELQANEDIEKICKKHNVRFTFPYWVYHK